MSGGPIWPGSAPPKLRKRSVVAAIILAAFMALAASYGGYQLLSAKQAPKPHDTAAAAGNQSKKPVPTTTKGAQAPKITDKPPTVTTQPSGSSAGSSTTTTKPPAKHSSSPTPTKSCKEYSNSFCYQWVGARQFMSASGVSVQFGQAEPATTGTALTGHTLVELSVGTSDGKQYVEVGWILPDVNGDKRPRLFVYHWVDGQTSCYNGCGFVQVSTAIHPGDPLTPGVAGTYKINYSGGQWQVFYNGVEVGYFPGSLWGGRFTQAGLAQIFGEVASSTLGTCTQMGNGIYGSAAGSLLISNYTLLGSGTTPYLTPYNVNNFSGSVNTGYNYGGVTSTSLRIGGPGSC